MIERSRTEARRIKADGMIGFCKNGKSVACDRSQDRWRTFGHIELDQLPNAMLEFRQTDGEDSGRSVRKNKIQLSGIEIGIRIHPKRERGKTGPVARLGEDVFDGVRGDIFFDRK